MFEANYMTSFFLGTAKFVRTQKIEGSTASECPHGYGPAQQGLQNALDRFSVACDQAE